MNSFIVFPTTSFIHHAAHVCGQRNLSIDHISITSRDNIHEKVNAVVSRYPTQTIFIFAPFAGYEKGQTDFENAIKRNVVIEWYGEFDQSTIVNLSKHKKLKLHSVNTFPKAPTHIENYLKYKKTLSFLGDKNGLFAIDHIKESIEHLSQSNQIPKNDLSSISAFAETDFPAIEGLSPKMTLLKKEIHRVAEAGLDKVLLLGETGTGKEAAAFFLHVLDPDRRNGRFGSINCAILQEELLISELFGHEKGAFTGATKQKRGLVSELDGGTLFLDELPDLPQRVQAMLLRFLESGTYTPLGSTHLKNADTKIVSASQKSLLIEKLQTKQFRQDLYYRIAGKTIKLPCLAEIPDDIPSLIVHLAYKIEQNSKKRDQAISYFLGRIDELRNHSWPGNVRELANYITRKVKLGIDEHINLDEISTFTSASPTLRNAITTIDNYSIDNLENIKRKYTKRVYDTLTGQGISQKAIGKQLGISVNTLKKLINTQA